MKYIGKNINVLLTSNKKIFIAGAFCGVLTAFAINFFCCDNFIIQKKASFKWDETYLDVDKNKYVLEVLGGRYEIFLDEYGMISSFEDYRKITLPDSSLCVIYYGFDIELNESSTACRMKEF